MGATFSANDPYSPLAHPPTPHHNLPHERKPHNARQGHSTNSRRQVQRSEPHLSREYGNSRASADLQVISVCTMRCARNDARATMRRVKHPCVRCNARSSALALAGKYQTVAVRKRLRGQVWRRETGQRAKGHPEPGMAARVLRSRDSRGRRPGRRRSLHHCQSFAGRVGAFDQGLPALGCDLVEIDGCRAHGALLRGGIAPMGRSHGELSRPWGAPTRN